MSILLSVALLVVIGAVVYGIVSCAMDMAAVNDEKGICSEADYDLSDKLATHNN